MFRTNRVQLFSCSFKLSYRNLVAMMGERFARMWRYYLSYCEGGFVERSIGDVQMLLVKPWARRRQYLPDLEPAV